MSFKALKTIILIAGIGWLIYKYGYPFYKNFNAPAESKKMYENLMDDGLNWQQHGHSTLGNPIYSIRFGGDGVPTLIFGGFHGDEPGGFQLVVELARFISANPDAIQTPVVLVPVLNPDGLIANTRTNANKTDINRNFPTQNWSPVYSEDRYYPGIAAGSEVETVLAMELLEATQPSRIISVHSALHVINYDGPAQSLAHKMARENGYEVSASIGYSTPGSFGTYAGKELKIPTITLELPLYDPPQAWQDNKEALLSAINF